MNDLIKLQKMFFVLNIVSDNWLLEITSLDQLLFLLIFFLIYITYFYEQVYCTEPSHSVSFLATGIPFKANLHYGENRAKLVGLKRQKYFFLLKLPNLEWFLP
jgi:hypothetical protein